MILELSLNGSVLCTAGGEHRAVQVNVHRTYSRSESPFAELTLHETVYRAPSTGEDLAPKLKAALQHPERPGTSYPAYWIDRKELKAGDEITIRLIDTPADLTAPIPTAAPNPS